MQHDVAVRNAALTLQFGHEINQCCDLRFGELTTLTVSDEADADGVFVEPGGIRRCAGDAISDMGARFLPDPTWSVVHRTVGLAVAIADDEVVAQRRKVPRRVLPREVADRTRRRS